jgi:hypothetical protein
MDWFSAGIGFLLGALAVWFLVRLRIIPIGGLSTISIGPIDCLSSSRISVQFNAIPGTDDVYDDLRVRGATYSTTGTRPDWDSCSASASQSPIEMDIGDASHDRLVLYCGFRRKRPYATDPLPSCSSSSGGSSSSVASGAEQPSALP